MARVPRATRIRRGNVEIVSKVDRAIFTLDELVHAANVDVGKYMSNQMRREARKLPGMRRSRRVNSFQYWARRREKDLIIGTKHDTWYGAQQELGSSNQPKRGIIRNSTYNNINEIRKIQGAYLSAIEDENRALGLITDENGQEGTD